jgi:hypothetical protein
MPEMRRGCVQNGRAYDAMLHDCKMNMTRWKRLKRIAYLKASEEGLHPGRRVDEA